MSWGRTTLQPGGAICLSRSSGCGVRRSVRRCSAAHFREDARGMQCEIWSESGRDQSLASVSLVGLRSERKRCRRLQSAWAPFGLLRRTRHATVGSCRRPTRAPWRLPASHQAQYSEKIVYLLYSYQRKDNKRQSRASKAPRPAYSIDDAEGYSGCRRKRGLSRRWPTPGCERHANPSSIGDLAGMGSTTAQMKPRLVSDRDQKAARFAQDIIELAAFLFRITSATPTSSLACSLGASERRQFLLIRKYSQDREAIPLARGARNRGAPN